MDNVEEKIVFGIPYAFAILFLIFSLMNTFTDMAIVGGIVSGDLDCGISHPYPFKDKQSCINYVSNNCNINVSMDCNRLGND